MSENKQNEPAAQKAELGFEQRVENVIKEVLDAKFKALDTRIDTMIETHLKAKEVEVEQALRKSFGVEQDPVVHKSDLIAAIRKAATENTEKERSPAAQEKASPDGNQKPDQLDELFKGYGV